MTPHQTCATCKQWIRSNRARHHYCHVLSDKRLPIAFIAAPGAIDARFVTDASFGCNQWTEAKLTNEQIESLRRITESIERINVAYESKQAKSST